MSGRLSLSREAWGFQLGIRPSACSAWGCRAHWVSMARGRLNGCMGRRTPPPWGGPLSLLSLENLGSWG